MENPLPTQFPRLPNERKLWQTVSSKMDMFEAAGLGWAVYAGISKDGVHNVYSQ
jgi:hypothetical protein